MYSFVYGVVVAIGTLVLAQLIDGRVALVIGLVALGLRWVHLRVRAAERRRFPGATDAALAKRVEALAELGGMRTGVLAAKKLGKMTEAEADARLREIDDLTAQWSELPGLRENRPGDAGQRG